MAEEAVAAIPEQPEQTTLREALESAFDKHAETPTAPEAAPVTEATPAAAVEPAPKDERPRGADGKFVEKDKTAAPPAPAPAAAAQVPAPAPVPAALKRPSSWSPKLEAQWQALPADTQKHILQRESEFANGVSTYKKEWEQVKPLQEALAPYRDVLAQYKIDPAQHVSELLRAHHTLATGTPQQKAAFIARTIQQYNVPLDSLLVSGQDGNFYFNTQLAQSFQPTQPQPAQPDVRATVTEILNQERARQSLAEFEQEHAGGKYQHYETVKEDMALLLEAGKARDLQDAYDKSVRMNDELWKSEQASTVQATEAERQRKAAEDAARARRNAASPRSSTPAGKPAAKNDNKGLRSTLEEAFDEHVGAGRV